MRLTNDLREQFLNAVMHDMPWKNTMTDALAVAEFEKRAFEALPADVKVLRKKYPGMLATKGANIPDMPKLLDINNVKGQWYGRYFNATIPNIVEAEGIKVDDIRKQVLKRDEEELQRHALRLQLRGVAYHATTTEELAAALPELAKWLPKPPPKREKSMALAPIGLVANLKKAGLPIAKGARA